ncbi:hypothetical protein J22TS3_22370 [Paenibacillus sp. J22TS3]|nr:hypothetical protein J22TS3_22370 [Paenibacillus sp. J22TS3]
MNRINRKLLTTLLVIIFYALACWVVDIMSSTAILNSSGRDYNIEFHFLYNNIIFYNQNNQVEYNEFILKFDRIFLFCIGVIYFVLKLINRNKKTM